MFETNNNPAAAPSETTESTISDARLFANRENAQKSCGPTSPEGKAKSRLNAVKSGLTGKHLRLPPPRGTQSLSRARQFLQNRILTRRPRRNRPRPIHRRHPLATQSDSRPRTRHPRHRQLKSHRRSSQLRLHPKPIRTCNSKSAAVTKRNCAIFISRKTASPAAANAKPPNSIVAKPPAKPTKKKPSPKPPKPHCLPSTPTSRSRKFPALGSFFQKSVSPPI